MQLNRTFEITLSKSSAHLFKYCLFFDMQLVTGERFLRTSFLLYIYYIYI